MTEHTDGSWATADEATKAAWRARPLWRVGDLEALCCGLIPRYRRADTAKLNAAREMIEDAIAVGDLVPDDPRPGTRIMGDGPGFRPANVVGWASRTFPNDFPFTPDDFDKPIGKRERDCLAWIIVALAGEAKLDLTKPSKASTIVSSWIASRGGSVAERTIENHLKDAVDRAR